MKTMTIQYVLIFAAMVSSFLALILVESRSSSVDCLLPDASDVVTMKAAVGPRGGIPIINPDIETARPVAVDEFIVRRAYC